MFLSKPISCAPAHYTVVQRLYTFSDDAFVDLAENSQGELVEILTIYPETDLLTVAAHRQVDHWLPKMKNQNLPGLQKVVEAGFMAEYGSFFTVFEACKDSEPFEAATLAEVINLAETLKTLKETNLTGFWICPACIGYQADGKPCLRWPGWFDVLVQMPDLDKSHLPLNVVKWYCDPANNHKPNFQDDQFQLANLLSDLADEFENERFAAFLYRALNETRTERFASYPAFLKELKALQSELEPEERLLFPVCAKPEDRAYLEPIIADMNEQPTYFCVNSDLSDKKGCVQGKFTTPNWSGSFYLDSVKNYIFIPANSCQNRENKRLYKDPNTFLANYQFVSCEFKPKNEPTEDVQSLITDKNRLAVQHKTQTQLLTEWKTLPQQEKAFVEKEAVLCHYQEAKEVKGHTKQVQFVLTGETLDNEKVKAWKRDKTVLCLNTGTEQKPQYLEIGIIADYNPQKQLLTVKDLKCAFHELPLEGKLEKDVTTEIIPFKKQIEACEAFQMGRTTNPRLCNILITPEKVALPYVHSPDFADFQSQLFNPNLKNDDQQAKAVLAALDHKPVYLIQGPPGTGKTTVIVELIQQLIAQNSKVRIMVVSQSNTAVDNVLKKLEKSKETKVSFVRLASPHAIEKDRLDREIQPYTYSAKLSEWSENVKKGSERALRENGNQFPELDGIIKDWHSLSANSQKTKNKDGKEPFLLNDGSRQVNCLTAMLMQTQVVGSTCIHIASSCYREANLSFDFVIMDESAKATAAETLVPINMGRNIVLIGDHLQLPPIITHEETVKENVRKELDDNGLDMNKTFGVSLFERLFKAFENDDAKKDYLICLNKQYRMPEQIGDLVSRHFYKGIVTTGGDEANKAHGLNFRKPTSALFVDTSKHDNPHDNDNPIKRQNRCNVEVIKGILAKLNEQLKSKDFKIGVIAAYRGQVEALNKAIDFEQYPNLQIAVNTVDSFQGSERDVIIYDVVRSSAGCSNIGFQTDYRRLNVAMSRAQKLLIMVGDGEYLLKRAQFTPEGNFKEFKLRSIVQELITAGFSTTNFSNFIV